MASLMHLAPALFGAMDPAESVLLAFDFSALADGLALSGAAVTLAVHDGVDADPNAMKVGGALIDGQTVLQRVTGGVAGATYRVRAQVDASDGSRYVLAGLLPVRAA